MASIGNHRGLMEGYALQQAPGHHLQAAGATLQSSPLILLNGQAPAAQFQRVAAQQQLLPQHHNGLLHNPNPTSAANPWPSHQTVSPATYENRLSADSKLPMANTSMSTSSTASSINNSQRTERMPSYRHSSSSTRAAPPLMIPHHGMHMPDSVAAQTMPQLTAASPNQIMPFCPLPFYFFPPQTPGMPGMPDSGEIPQMPQMASVPPVANMQEAYQQYIAAATMYNQWLMVQMEQMSRGASSSRAGIAERLQSQRGSVRLPFAPFFPMGYVAPSEFDARSAVGTTVGGLEEINSQHGAASKYSTANTAAGGKKGHKSSKRKERDRSTRTQGEFRSLLYSGHPTDPETLFSNFRAARAAPRFGGICC